MSELKAYRPRQLVMQGRHNDPIYLKSEADNVIAEKDAEIARLKAIRKVHVEAIESMGAGLLQDEEENRHSKYKRCLAMARIAQDDWHLHNSFYAMGHQEFEKRKCDFYDKWHRRWLAIAKQFKQNSTINRKGGTNALQR